MSVYLVLVGGEGAAVYERRDEEWVNTARGLEDQRATCAAVSGEALLVGTEAGLYRSTDLGSSWQAVEQGLAQPHLRWLAVHPDEPQRVLAGTEPAVIYLSTDGGQTWRECPEAAEMRDRFGWTLPYSPEPGCVRGFAMQGDWAFAAVEDGAVLVSSDRGETWQLAGGSAGKADHDPKEGNVHSDVHSVEVIPPFPDQVYAPTGGGFYVSKDGGNSWETWYGGAYCRAAWVDPGDPSRVVLGPAEGVDRNGYILTTYDAGRTWNSASDGLDVPLRNTMVERFVYFDDGLLAVLSNGEVYSAQASGLIWRRLLPELNSVAAAAFLVQR
jgi:photosystem II stability/assembly factor-like uncharacterized protein